jgi:hypothetical protein
MMSWLPEPSKAEVLAEVEAKRPFIGDEAQGPGELPRHSFRVPGPYKRPQRAWPSFTYFPPPAVIDMAKWRFETYGLVDTPLSLTYEELKALPSVSSVEDHACFDQVATPGHGFEGVSLRTIIELTGADPACEWLLFECEGGVTSSVSIYHPIILVYGRDGEPLDPSHGYPLRVWMPGEWGYRNSKWLRKLKFCERREPDFWFTWFKQVGMADEAVAGVDGHMGSEIDFETIEGANKRMYIEFQRQFRHDPLGPRGLGFSQYRAPVYLNDKNWPLGSYEVTY